MVIFKNKQEAISCKKEFLEQAVAMHNNKLLLGLNDRKKSDLVWISDNVYYSEKNGRFSLRYDTAMFNRMRYGRSVEFYVPDWIDVYVEFDNLKGDYGKYNKKLNTRLFEGAYAFNKHERHKNTFVAHNMNVDIDKVLYGSDRGAFMLMAEELINNLTRIDTINLNTLELIRHEDLHQSMSWSCWVVECYKFLQFPDELLVGNVNIDVASSLTPLLFGSESTLIQYGFSLNSLKHGHARFLDINLRVPKKITKAETKFMQNQRDKLWRETGNYHKVIAEGFVDIPFLYDYINIYNKYHRRKDREFITSMHGDEITVKLANSGISYHIRLV